MEGKAWEEENGREVRTGLLREKSSLRNDKSGDIYTCTCALNYFICLSVTCTASVRGKISDLSLQCQYTNE